MDTGHAVLLLAVGLATGTFGCWWLIASYYTAEQPEREKELWKRIAELEALLKVPPLFWQVWARYTDEITQHHPGAQAADDAGQASESEGPDGDEGQGDRP